MKNNIKMDLKAMYQKAKILRQGLKVFQLGDQAFYITYDDNGFQSIDFKDHSDNSVRIDFSDTVFDADLEENLFNFNPSQELDIIYED